MLTNPIVAILHNARRNRWHPIIFNESPLPGEPSHEKPIRHKSEGYHAEGFGDRTEALKEAQQIRARIIEHKTSDTCGLALEEDIPWDGQNIPATVAFFIETSEGQFKCLF